MWYSPHVVQRHKPGGDCQAIPHCSCATRINDVLLQKQKKPPPICVRKRKSNSTLEIQIEPFVSICGSFDKPDMFRIPLGAEAGAPFLACRVASQCNLATQYAGFGIAAMTIPPLYFVLYHCIMTQV
jgi:hypothetical protein